MERWKFFRREMLRLLLAESGRWEVAVEGVEEGVEVIADILVVYYFSEFGQEGFLGVCLVV